MSDYPDDGHARSGDDAEQDTITLSIAEYYEHRAKIARVDVVEAENEELRALIALLKHQLAEGQGEVASTEPGAKHARAAKCAGSYWSVGSRDLQSTETEVQSTIR